MNEIILEIPEGSFAREVFAVSWKTVKPLVEREVNAMKGCISTLSLKKAQKGPYYLTITFNRVVESFDWQKMVKTLWADMMEGVKLATGKVPADAEEVTTQ